MVRTKWAGVHVVEALQVGGAGVLLFGAGFAMAFFEWSRSKTAAPLLAGTNVIQLYWITYLILFVLGVTLVAAAIIR